MRGPSEAAGCFRCGCKWFEIFQDIEGCEHPCCVACGSIYDFEGRAIQSDVPSVSGAPAGGCEAGIGVSAAEGEPEGKDAPRLIGRLPFYSPYCSSCQARRQREINRLKKYRMKAKGGG